MKAFCTLMFSLLCICLLANAQQHPTEVTKARPAISEHELNSCSGEHRPGDHLTCYVVFDGDPNFTDVGFLFTLRGQQQADQRGLTPNFWVAQFRKIGRGEYSVEANVPYCATGTYAVQQINVSIANTGATAYFSRTDFPDVIQIQVKNSEEHLFPPIKMVSVEPPKGAPADSKKE